LYHYAGLNPVKLFDLDGEETYLVVRDLRSFPLGIHSFTMVITTDPREYGKYASNFKKYTNKTGAIPSIKKGETFYAMVLSGTEDEYGRLVKAKEGMATYKSDHDAIRELVETGGNVFLPDNDVKAMKYEFGNDIRGEIERDLSIINAFERYNEMATYELEAKADRDTYNCHSLTNTIAHRGKVKNMPKLTREGIAPGQHIIPNKYFIPFNENK
jgi:hypothetical protein